MLFSRTTSLSLLMTFFLNVFFLNPVSAQDLNYSSMSGNDWLSLVFSKLQSEGPQKGLGSYIAVTPPAPFIFGKKIKDTCSMEAVIKTERDLRYSEGYIDNRYIQVTCPNGFVAFISPDIHGEADVIRDEDSEYGNNIIRIRKNALKYLIEVCRIDGCHKAEVILTIDADKLEVKKFYFTLPGKKEFIYPVLNSYKKVKFEFVPNK